MPQLQLTGRDSGCAAACGRVGGVVIANLYRVLLLAIIITLVVLVSINVRFHLVYNLRTQHALSFWMHCHALSLVLHVCHSR